MIQINLQLNSRTPDVMNQKWNLFKYYAWLLIYYSSIYLNKKFIYLFTKKHKMVWSYITSPKCHKRSQQRIILINDETKFFFLTPYSYLQHANFLFLIKLKKNLFSKFLDNHNFKINTLSFTTQLKVPL